MKNTCFETAIDKNPPLIKCCMREEIYQLSFTMIKILSRTFI